MPLRRARSIGQIYVLVPRFYSLRKKSYWNIDVCNWVHARDHRNLSKFRLGADDVFLFPIIYKLYRNTAPESFYTFYEWTELAPPIFNELVSVLSEAVNRTHFFRRLSDRPLFGSISAEAEMDWQYQGLPTLIRKGLHFYYVIKVWCSVLRNPNDRLKKMMCFFQKSPILNINSTTLDYSSEYISNWYITHIYILKGQVHWVNKIIKRTFSQVSIFTNHGTIFSSTLPT